MVGIVWHQLIALLKRLLQLLVVSASRFDRISSTVYSIDALIDVRILKLRVIERSPTTNTAVTIITCICSLFPPRHYESRKAFPSSCIFLLISLIGSNHNITWIWKIIVAASKSTLPWETPFLLRLSAPMPPRRTSQSPRSLGESELCLWPTAPRLHVRNWAPSSKMWLPLSVGSRILGGSIPRESMQVGRFVVSLCFCFVLYLGDLCQ